MKSIQQQSHVTIKPDKNQFFYNVKFGQHIRVVLYIDVFITQTITSAATKCNLDEMDTDLSKFALCLSEHGMNVAFDLINLCNTIKFNYRTVMASNL